LFSSAKEPQSGERMQPMAKAVGGEAGDGSAIDWNGLGVVKGKKSASGTFNGG